MTADLAPEHDNGGAVPLHIAEHQLGSFEIDILNLEAHGGSNADARREQQREERVIASAVIARERFEQALLVFGAQPTGRRR